MDTPAFIVIVIHILKVWLSINLSIFWYHISFFSVRIRVGGMYLRNGASETFPGPAQSPEITH